RSTERRSVRDRRRGPPAHVVSQRLAPRTHPVEAGGCQGGVLEHGIERPPYRRRLLLHGGRAERRLEPSQVEDGAGELVPRAAALVGGVIEPRSTLEGQHPHLR